MSPTAAQHLDAIKEKLNAPPKEARFWNESSKGERRYLLMSAEHTPSAIDDDCRRSWSGLNEQGRAAAARGYRNVMGWANNVADRGAVSEFSL